MEPKLFRIFTKVSTPVGIFTGFSSGDIETLEEASAERDKIQELLRNCDSFTFFSDSQPGTDITLSRTVIDNSVFELTVVHEEPSPPTPPPGPESILKDY